MPLFSSNFRRTTKPFFFGLLFYFIVSLSWLYLTRTSLTSVEVKKEFKKTFLFKKLTHESSNLASLERFSRRIIFRSFCIPFQSLFVHSNRHGHWLFKVSLVSVNKLNHVHENWDFSILSDKTPSWTFDPPLKANAD